MRGEGVLRVVEPCPRKIPSKKWPSLFDDLPSKRTFGFWVVGLAGGGGRSRGESIS